MSIRVMTLVWDRSDLTGVNLLALLAIADNANDEGIAWPSQDYLAVKTRQSDRNLRRILASVIEKGELTLEERGTYGRSNRYRVNLEALEAKEPKMSALTPAQSGHSGDGSPGQQLSVLGGQVLSSEPSTEPSKGSEEPKEELLTDPVAQLWTAWETAFEGRVRLGLTERRRGSLARALKAVDGNLEICLAAVRGFKTWLDANPTRNQSADIGRVFETGMHDTKNLTDKILGWAKEAGDEVRRNPMDNIPAVHRSIVSEHVQRANRLIQGKELSEARATEARESITWLQDNWSLHGSLRDDGTVQWEKR